MTIIQDFGTWHVERHLDEFTLDNTTTDSNTITFDRPGTVLSIQSSMSGNTASPEQLLYVTNASGTVLTAAYFSGRQTSCRIIFRNETGGTITLATITTVIISDQR